ncbi:MAG: ABC transporter ATP-binding protein [Candidatus Nanopelagicales bacterium]
MEAPQATSAAAAAAPISGAVAVSHLTKVFEAGGPPVLLDVDLVVGAGEFVCLLGASGCGKSTLLNILAGLDQPTSGTVTVAGTRVALMFQESALFPWLTAAGNIDLALRLAGVPKAERPARVEDLLVRVHLGGQGGKRVHELSGGMRQRVALARALAQDAHVLLMDEPFAALDAITRDVLHDELSTIWRETGLTVIFVTHNVREAVRLGQRVLLMSSRPGRIVAEWHVELDEPRAMDTPAVAELASTITAQLRQEIRRHAR